MIFTDNDFDGMSDAECIARVAWGEARSLGREGLQATINTMQNRVSSRRLWWGSDLRGCALAHGKNGVYQYSCLNLRDPNRTKLLGVSCSDPQYQMAETLAALALTESMEDLTNGADSYFDSRMPAPPYWIKGLEPVASIGTHLFFKTI